MNTPDSPTLARWQELRRITADAARAARCADRRVAPRVSVVQTPEGAVLHVTRPAGPAEDLILDRGTVLSLLASLADIARRYA